jgi:uncharacterized damage-inducible protein DinB
MSFAEHARSLVSYNEWANEKVLDAAQRCSEPEFAEVHVTFAHVLGTQLFWRSLWAGRPIQGVEEQIFRELAGVKTAQQMWEKYAMSHDDLRSFAMGVEDVDWHRAKQWWVPYTDASLPLGDTILQVVLHGMQHRAEIATIISRQGHSPGELDLLNFKFEMLGNPMAFEEQR